MFINMNMWILLTNTKCAIFCTQVMFLVIKRKSFYQHCKS